MGENDKYSLEDKPKISPEGFIVDYQKAVLSDIPTSPDWAEAIACTLLAVATPHIRLTTKIGPLSLNVWNLTIGPSGMAHKTTPLNYYVFPTLSEFTDLVERPMIFPSRFSVEGLIEYVSLRNKQGKCTNNEGCFVRDEFSSMFKDSKAKEYLADVMEFLSEIYDGSMQKRYTRKAKLENSAYVYVNLLAATTPYVFQCLERGFFIQGTGNRIDYDWYESKPPDKFKRDFFATGVTVQERENKIRNFAGALAELYNSRVKYIFPMDDAADLWLDFKYEIDTESYKRFKANKHDIIYTYLQRMPVRALKYSALWTLSKAIGRISKQQHDTMMIRKDAMEWGIEHTRKIIRKFHIILEQWDIQPEEVAPEVHERELMRMAGFFRESPDGYLTQKELLKLSGMVRNEDFYNLISTLVARGDIKSLTDDEVKALPDATKELHCLTNFRGNIPNVFFKEPVKKLTVSGEMR